MDDTGDVARIVGEKYAAWESDPRTCPHLKEGYRGSMTLVQGMLRCPDCVRSASSLDCDWCGRDMTIDDRAMAVAASGKGGATIELRFCAVCHPAVDD